MTKTNEAPPQHKDRIVGLVVFGVTGILVGICCALLVPLTFLSVALSPSAGGGFEYRSAWAASALYGVIAVVFVWLGVGSIRARLWARELMLSLSWIWLLTGICSLIIGILVVPAALAVLGTEAPFPPKLILLIVVVTFGVIGLLYVVLPGLFVLFYRSPDVAATCRARNPQPHWFDECPRRVVTLAVVWALAAVSVLLMPAYDFFFPIFGVALTGAAGAAMWAVVLALFIVLTVGTCRQAPWAWWAGVVCTVAAAVSSILTLLRYDLAEIMVLMEMPADQTSMVTSLGIQDGWPMVLINALVWGSFVVYLMTLRRYFVSARIPADE